MSALQRIPLVHGPTASERCAALSAKASRDVFAKRDDQTNPLYGGNKVRKLEWLLGEATQLGANTLITTGAYGSHHVVATSVHGSAAGFKVHAAMNPQPMNAHVQAHLRATLSAGTIVHPVATYADATHRLWSLATALRSEEGTVPYAFGQGGSTPTGALGYVEAALEIDADMRAQRLPAISRVVTAAGSAGTIAGLAVGFAALGHSIRVHAVRTTSKLAMNREVVRALVVGTCRKLGELYPSFLELVETAMALIDLDDEQFGEGYGHDTAAAQEAMSLAAQDGLELDTTYTAKAVAALLEHSARDEGDGAYLYLHTLSSAPLERIIDAQMALPSWALSAQV